MTCAWREAATSLTFAEKCSRFWSFENNQFELKAKALDGCCRGTFLDVENASACICSLRQSDKRLREFAVGLARIWGLPYLKQIMQVPDGHKRVGYFAENADQPTALWRWWFEDCFADSISFKVVPSVALSKFAYAGEPHVAIVGFEKKADYGSLFALETLIGQIYNAGGQLTIEQRAAQSPKLKSDFRSRKFGGAKSVAKNFFETTLSSTSFSKLQMICTQKVVF